MKHVRREYVCNDLDIMVVFEEKLKDEMKDEGYVGNGESTRQRETPPRPQIVPTEEAQGKISVW